MLRYVKTLCIMLSPQQMDNICYELETLLVSALGKKTQTESLNSVLIQSRLERVLNEALVKKGAAFWE